MGTAGRPPSSYIDLYRRVIHLDKANKHLEHLIKERSCRSSFSSHGDDKVFNNQDIATSELKRHQSTIELQIEVTNYMYTAMIPTEGNCDNERIPTLFGNGKERAEVVIKVSYLFFSLSNKI